MSVKLIIASLINQLVTFPRSKGKIVVYITHLIHRYLQLTV